MLLPSAMALLAAARIASTPALRPAPPLDTSKSAGMVMLLNPCELAPPSRLRSFSSSSLRRTGVASSIWRAEAGVGSSRFPSGPMAVSTAMMISSRMASTGGFVTCANSCLK